MRSLSAVALLLAATVSAAAAQNGTSAPVAVLRSGPEVGRLAPDFTLPWASSSGVGPAESPYQLWGDRGKTVVLVFFPRAFTKTSTAQMRTLTERYDTLFGPGVVVVGLSTDPPDTHRQFAAEVGLPFRLLTDEGQRVAKKYGSHGSDGLIRRSVYVIGPDGKVAYRDMSFDPTNQKEYRALGAAVRSAQGIGGRD